MSGAMSLHPSEIPRVEAAYKEELRWIRDQMAGAWYAMHHGQSCDYWERFLAFWTQEREKTHQAWTALTGQEPMRDVPEETKVNDDVPK